MRSTLKETGERFLRKHITWGGRWNASAFLILQRWISVSSSRLGSAGGSPQQDLHVPPSLVSCRNTSVCSPNPQTAQELHNPQQELPGSLEELPTGNRDPAGEADKGCFTTRAAVAFDKP